MVVRRWLGTVTSWGGIKLAIVVASGVRVIVLHRQSQESGRQAPTVAQDVVYIDLPT